MLKRRLIPVLYIKNGFIVRSEDFSIHQRLGNIISEAKRYNDWDVDELIYIDISRENTYDFNRDDHKIKSYFSIDEIIKKISEVCFMPLTFGGGIRTMADIDLRIQNGADKITLNTGAILTPDLINFTSLKYGSQCIVISIDYRIIDDKPIVFSDYGRNNTQKTVFEWVTECEDRGAGEIFLKSMDRDGKANGYDIKTINEVAEKTNLPMIAGGGAGDEYDFLDLAEASSVSGIAAGNWFHFVERSYTRAKKLLKKNKINIR